MRRTVLRIAAVVVAIPLLAATLAVVAAAWLYSPEYVFRTMAWRESDVGDYLNNFPQRRLTASPNPLRFARGQDEASAVLAQALGTDHLDAFLTQTKTQSLIVIRRDQVVLEWYGDRWRRDSMMTSFSVAKSFVSTLVGMAIDEGAITRVDDPVPSYLPELPSGIVALPRSRSAISC